MKSIIPFEPDCWVSSDFGRSALWAVCSVILAMLLTGPLKADELDASMVDTAPSPGSQLTFTIYSDNDAPTYKPNDSSDRHYTAGNGFSLHHRPECADEIARFMPFADAFGPAETGLGYFAYHVIHTPQNLNRARPIPLDTPYSGHFNFGTYWQRVDPGRTTLDHFQLEIGFVGPAAAGESIQRWFHKNLDSDEPKGWDNQLDDEVTVNLHVRKKWRVLQTQADMAGLPLQFDLIPQAGAGLGTVRTQLEALIKARVGMNVPDDFGPGRLFDFADATSSPPDGWSLYTFATVGGRLIAHDLYTDGTVFHSSRFTVDSEPAVGELRWGLNASYRAERWSAALGYAQTFLTREFDTQDEAHSYGSWMLAFQYDF